jgi:chromosomal replication initiation ATPase DnaA
MNAVTKLMSFIDKSKIVEARQALRDIRVESFRSDRQMYFFEINELEAQLDRIYYYIWETSLEEVKKKNRKEHVLFMRQVGIYCLYTTLKFTDLQVGEIFDRDRTTILHSVKVMRNRIATDSEAKRKTHHFRRLLNDVLGQMEIENIKKQEYAENTTILPIEQQHFSFTN